MLRVPTLLFLFAGACAVAPPVGPLHATASLADDAAAAAPAARPAAATPIPAAAAAAPQGSEWRARNYFDVMFGATYWDGLGDLDPTGVSPVPGRFGDFDDWGTAFDFGYDRVVWNDRKNAVTVGVETGWTAFDNNGSGLSSSYSDISATMWYLTPVVRWRRELAPGVVIVPGIGAGYYGLSIDEYETYYYGWWWGYSTRTLYDDDTFGGFVSLGFDFQVSPSSIVRIDNKLHHASFGGLRSLMPNESSVDGPIYTIEVGFAFAF